MYNKDYTETQAKKAANKKWAKEIHIDNNCDRCGIYTVCLSCMIFESDNIINIDLCLECHNELKQ